MIQEYLTHDQKHFMSILQVLEAHMNAPEETGSTFGRPAYDQKPAACTTKDHAAERSPENMDMRVLAVEEFPGYPLYSLMDAVYDGRD
jgi:hypothetical protein